jgi:hypothetical protein
VSIRRFLERDTRLFGRENIMGFLSRFPGAGGRKERSVTGRDGNVFETTGRSNQVKMAVRNQGIP